MRSILLAAVLAGLGGLELTAISPQSLPVFKAAVDLVPISVVVHDSRGRMITTLGAADFEVLDKGERRRILDFQVDDTSPITMAVLVDMSGSMRLSSKMAFARAVVGQLADNLQDGRDEVSLFTFDSALHEQQAFTDHPARIDAALTNTEPFGVTSLYDAIAETARRLGARPSPRRAIVVLTDGVDTSSALTPPEVSAMASAIDAPVYIVATAPRIDRAVFIQRAASRDADSPADLQELAAWTGGDLLWVSGAEEGAARARHILFELRHQYLLAIDSSGGGDWRPLDVRVRDRRLVVRARSGYFGRGGPATR